MRDANLGRDTERNVGGPQADQCFTPAIPRMGRERRTPTYRRRVHSFLPGRIEVRKLSRSAHNEVSLVWVCHDQRLGEILCLFEDNCQWSEVTPNWGE